MNIATQLPRAQWDGRFVVLTAKSGCETIELAITPHEALHLGHQLVRAGEVPVLGCQTGAEIIPFQRRKKAVR